MDYLPALVLFAAIAIVTPGPNNMMIMSSGLNFGVRASMPHLFGICLGVPVLLLALGLGATVLFENLPWLHILIQVVGLSYLVYLAYRIASTVPGKLEDGRSRPLSFIEAAFFQWVNPKTWMMGSSAIATFTSVDNDMATQVAVIVVVFFLMTWPGAGVWLLFGAGLKKFLSNPVQQRLFNWTMALLLLLSMQGVARELISDLLF